MTATLHALPEPDALEDLDVLRQIKHLTEIDQLTTVAQFLAEHGESTLDPQVSRLPGRQRAVRLGGVGTPPVAEFAPALVGGRLEISTWAAERLCADVLDLQHRLPLLWASVGEYVAKASLARLVAAKTRHLSLAQAGLVDARVAESCDGRLGYGRFLALVEATVATVDAEAVAAREEQAAHEQFARASRTTVNGMRGFYIRAAFPIIARLEATVAHLADALAAMGHPGTVDERRVLAVLVLANPTHAVRLLAAYHHANRDPADHHEVGDQAEGVSSSSLAGARSGSTNEGCGHPPVGFVLGIEKLLPAVVVYLHLTDHAASTGTGTERGVARVEGIETEREPLTAAWVRSWLGPRARFTIKPVLVPENTAPVDGWEVPARHREAVHLMTPADVFPWAANTTRAVQIDHTIPFDRHGPPGQSRIGNYGPMTTRHHRIKTHGGWQCRQPFPGIYLWRDPTGATYLVDHTGTRRLHPPKPAA